MLVLVTDTPRPRAHKLGLLAVAIVAVLGIGVAVAAAQTDSTASSSTTTTAAPGLGGPGPGFGRKAPGRDRLGMKGLGLPGGAIHGEFTVPDGNGGFRTMTVQTGTVTSVSTTSIEVKSADGFTKKYAVDDGTLVNAGRDGIANVKAGDTVTVRALGSGSTAKAVAVNDLTNIKALRGRWAPAKPSK